ncbi:MAG TPA: carbon-nitrogen hydrolase [Candidatus Thermoplasmatota archaeon]|jgi:N-carbamoylputrescine amidase|nr:carbon-nitrogen hydrolase [Candidatus Thermoplasmatota archaeon]
MREAESVTIGLVQMRMERSPDANVQHAADLVGQAARKGAQIVCLPELFRTPYFPITEDHANFELAEGIPGPTTEALGKVAAAHNITIIAPVFERRARGLFHNALAVLGPDGEVRGRYRKMHIPDDPNFYEKFYFAPGDTGFKAFDAPQGKFGAMICWDQWYPEAARLTALAGAQVLFYPTAIGYSSADRAHYAEQREAWRTIQRAHAIANGLFVAVVNRVGKEGDLTFWGSSFVAGPMGEVLTAASEDKEEILLAKLDLAAIDRTRQAWPFLRDRRVDAYGGITQRFLDEER